MKVVCAGVVVAVLATACGSSEGTGGQAAVDPVAPVAPTVADTPSAQTSDAMAVCVDGVGDVTALGNFEMDETVATVTDLLQASIEVVDDSILVSWRFAEGSTAALAAGGNHTMQADLEPVDGGYPIVRLHVGRSSGVAISTLTSTTQSAGVVTETDSDGQNVAVSGDTVTVKVPVAKLHGLGATRWHWSADGAMGRAVGGSQHMGQDACGSADAGAGSTVVYRDGPTLPAVMDDGVEAPPVEAAHPMCAGVPVIDRLSAIVGVELQGPNGRYDTECSYFGVSDPTDYVLFSGQPGAPCSSDAALGVLGDVPYVASGGIAGVVDLCVGGEEFRVTTSIGSIDDDDGPLALELAAAWVEMFRAGPAAAG